MAQQGQPGCCQRPGGSRGRVTRSRRCAFHSQQAVEKAIKAFLTWYDIPFGKTHDLRKLLELGYPADASLASLLDDVEPLSKFAWMYRYPATVEEPRHDKTLRVFADARRLVTEILGRLPSEVRRD